MCKYFTNNLFYNNINFYGKDLSKLLLLCVTIGENTNSTY